MPQSRPIYNSFTSGVFAPRLYGRVDLARYYSGAQMLENFVVLSQGGAVKRKGTRFVAEVKDSTRRVRLVRFEFSTVQAYILEFGHQYIRFYRNQGQIESSPGVAYEIASPYLESQLFELQFAQSADVMWIVHPGFEPRKLTRTGHTSWTLTIYSPTGDPFTGPDDYPSAVTFFEQRLIFAATNKRPQALWSTKTGDFEDMTVGTADDDAWNYEIASGSVNAIQWILGADTLLVGTVANEYQHQGSLNDPITPSNINLRAGKTGYGSAPIQPIATSSAVLFVAQSGKKVRELAYVLNDDSYRAPDLTLLSAHLFGNEVKGTGKAIRQFVQQKNPTPILWAVTNADELVGLTYERDQEVVAWHGPHLTRGAIESVQTVPATDGGADEVWVVANRTIDGDTKRYVEYLTPDEEAQERRVFVDSSLEYDGVPTKTITGLNHLNKEWVSVLADGAVHPDVQVLGNSITLEYEASVVQVGLGFEGVLEPMPFTDPSAPIAGTKRRLVRPSVLVNETSGIEINGYAIPTRIAGEPMNAPSPLRSEYVKLGPNLGWRDDATIRITSSLPLPAEVLMITGWLDVSDQ